jgi:hypothetical protein
MVNLFINDKTTQSIYKYNNLVDRDYILRQYVFFTPTSKLFIRKWKIYNILEILSFSGSNEMISLITVQRVFKTVNNYKNITNINS